MSELDLDAKALAGFLNKKHLEFMNLRGRKMDVTEFAIYIGVAQPSLSQWMRGVGRKPNLENLVRIATKLGVKETFHAVGLGRMYDTMMGAAFEDPRFGEVAVAWFDLDEDAQARIVSIARGGEDHAAGTERVVT